MDDMHYEGSAGLLDFCRQMPKVELHAHLNGSISDSTMQKLTERYRQILIKSSTNPSFLDEWCTTIEKGDKRTLQECFAMFKMIHTIVCDEDAVAMVAHDVVSEFATDGVVYLELRSTPRDNPSTGMTKKKYIDAVLDGIDRAVSVSRTPIHVRLLLSIDRSRGLSDALETVELAESYSKPSSSHHTRVVGIDLSGNPKVGDVKKLLPVLKKAKKVGLKLSVHLSEIPGVNEETKLLLDLHPERIGHGTFLVPTIGGSKENIELITKYNIPIELCLTSNLKCQTVPSYDQHQLGFWIDNHHTHPVIICTDDKGVFATTLSQEYYIAAQTFNMSTSRLWTLSSEAVEYIFDDALKDELRHLWKTVK